LDYRSASRCAVRYADASAPSGPFCACAVLPGTYESRAGECALIKDLLSAPGKRAVLPLRGGETLRPNCRKSSHRLRACATQPEAAGTSSISRLTGRLTKWFNQLAKHRRLRHLVNRCRGGVGWGWGKLAAVQARVAKMEQAAAQSGFDRFRCDPPQRPISFR
jgi:hypothetical protein